MRYALCVMNGGEGHHEMEGKMIKRRKRILATFVLAGFLLAAAIGTVMAQEQVKININKATVDELVSLKRVGPAYAQRIVDYRKQNGPFEKPEDIMNVPGIGPKTYEANKDMITCE